MRARPAFAALAFLVLAAWASSAMAQGAASDPAAAPVRVLVAVLPFQVQSTGDVDYLETTLASLLTSRLEASGRVQVVDAVIVREALVEYVAGERSEALLRQLAQRLDADWIVEGSLTELAGDFSLNVRVAPAAEGASARSLAHSARGEEQLLLRVNTLSEQVLEIVTRTAPATTATPSVPRGMVAEVRIDASEDLDLEPLRARLRTRAPLPLDPAAVRADLESLRTAPGVGTATVDTEPVEGGVVVTFRVTSLAELVPEEGPVAPEDSIAEIRVVGNRRIEADAIRARISSRPGDRYSPVRVSEDLRQVHALGFFRNIQIYREAGPEGSIVTFEVEENPIVRQITIAGNDKIDAERIRDQLTLTTGATLDVPLLYENRERVGALYRAEGYYLAQVQYSIDPLPNDAVAVHFEVVEGEKLRLRKIAFEGNEHFTDKELQAGLRTKRWRFWSYVTRYLDKSGTYSEPVFAQDLQKVEERYADAGYLRVEVAEPQVSHDEKGLIVTVPLVEGPRFKVGRLDVAGDATADLGEVRDELLLADDEWFNRSHLRGDVERLTQRYADRGYLEARVNPATLTDESTYVVDVDFEVEKGRLFFVRQIDVAGNTRTLDRVVRREMRLVEGELYSKRRADLSQNRLNSLGFFEEVNLAPQPTDAAEEVDLAVNVVEKPTGSLSFGAGFSSQDSFVLSGALTQDNLFGRGYAVRASADFGGNRDRFFLSFANRRLFDSEYSLSLTGFQTDVNFEDFSETSLGVDLNVGRSLDEANRTRGFVRYTFANREIEADSNITAAGLIFREFLQDSSTTSAVGVAFRSDTRDDRVLPTDGYEWATNLEFAGLGGFANFLRLEGRAAWYTRPPSWIPLGERSSFSLSARAGYTFPFNSISDFDLPKPASPVCVNMETCPLTLIDDDLDLPLTERYFLGGIGTFQLRGYESRSVGPRRAVLYETTSLGDGSGQYSPLGVSGGVCVDDGSILIPGNANGKCNSLDDKKDDDFEDLEETDVIGGSQFISMSAEYRFPISEQLGLVGIIFLDAGDAMSEEEFLFDASLWRFGTGVGALWFSPFGPLQVFWGVPINRLEVEESSVFEFSVGGTNL